MSSGSKITSFDDDDDDVLEKTSDKIVEFTCSSRERDDEGNWHYFVERITDYEDLDFVSRDVKINGVVRRCFDFYLDDSEDDDHMVIVVKS